MTTLKTAVRRTPRPAPFRRSVRWGAIAALAAISLQAHATGYTRIVAGGLPFESLSGAPLQYAASDSAASASAMGVTSSASNVGNWVGGPYVTGQSDLGFGIAGAAGTFSTVTLQVSIVADTTMGSAFDHNTNVSFGAVLSGNASTFNSAAWGSAVSIYCGGCGGLIEVGTINLDYRSLYHHFEDAVWMKDTACIPAIEKDFQKTLEFCRDVEPTRESIWEGKTLLHLAGVLLKVIAPLL